MAEVKLFNACLSKAMALCSRREYCIADIRSRLLVWGLGEKDADKAIESLVMENFINEKRYSLAFVKDKFTYNRWGKVKIASSLKMKKIPADLIKTALESIEYDLYINTLKDLVLSHRKSVKARNSFELKGKLLRYGLSKGFESNLLYDLINDIE
ncbi:MAG: regulatory protein RecX [Bacteroidales bacterium]|jgi:regulatory protein